MSVLDNKVRALPASPGVYLFKDDQGKVIYIGKAVSLRNRVQQYLQSGHDGRYQYEALVQRIADVEVIATDTELEALILESNLVREHKPRYNVDLKDDKSFPFLRITNEQFPRVLLTRHPVMDGSRYFGPYSDLYHLKGLLRLLRSMLKIRTCNLPLTEDSVAAGKFKACLEFHIGRCNAPCIANESRVEYTCRVRDFVEVVCGRGAEVVRRLEQEMQQLAEGLKFEQAAQMRDWLGALDGLTERQKIISPEPINRDIYGLAIEDDLGCVVVLQVRAGRMVGRLHYRLRHVAGRPLEEVLASALERYYGEPVTIPEEIILPLVPPEIELLREWIKQRAGFRVELKVPARGEKAQLSDLAQRNAELQLGQYKATRAENVRQPASLRELQKQLHLAKLPREIAAFDISTLQGADKVASMVVFKLGRATRSQYRRFKIRTVAGMDDFASMREVVGRRFRRLLAEEQPLPDLVLVDGGKGQLVAALDALQELNVHDVPAVGLAKRLEEIFLPNDPSPHYLPRTSSALRLLQQVRDEAHRFAVTYHRGERKKRTLASGLETIEGVGPSRRKALISHFGTVKALREATLEQIQEVPGVPKDVASRVFRHLHQPEAPPDE